MNVRREMPLASTLVGSAAKLLIHLLFDADGSENDAALMRGCGITDRRTYATAKAQVREVLGEQELHALRAVITRTMQELHAGDAVITAQRPPVSILRGNAPGVRAQATAEVIHHTPPSVSLLDELLDADNLPDTGEWNSPKSPVRMRRQTQITLLQRGYRELFGKELTQTSAQELLRLSGDRAAPVYGALEKAKERGAEYPVGYAKKVLQAEPKQQEVRAVNVAGDGEDFYLAQPSAAYQAKLAKMQALGLLDGED